MIGCAASTIDPWQLSLKNDVVCKAAFILFVIGGSPRVIGCAAGTIDPWQLSLLNDVLRKACDFFMLSAAAPE